MHRVIALLFVTICMAGCGDTNVANVNLGSVSIGQQLIDLKAAKEADAISDPEYLKAKEAILSIGALHTRVESQANSESEANPESAQ